MDPFIKLEKPRITVVDNLFPLLSLKDGLKNSPNLHESCLEVYMIESFTLGEKNGRVGVSDDEVRTEPTDVSDESKVQIPET